MDHALGALAAALNRGDAAAALHAFAPGARVADPIGSDPVSGADLDDYVRGLVDAHTRIEAGEVRSNADGTVACMPVRIERDDADHPGYRIRVTAALHADMDPAGRISMLRSIWGPDNIAPTDFESPRYAASLARLREPA
ncbi:hypothetical protein CLV63_12418 [Murinocardiopsis flavida]|uniref:SnoaL-like domain-containing protein n=1 Tax=Murinocardiopsis flavida TaxID=645275 RepID=A0A2P8CY50_9ACTN|nr:nuclear transport factor 2 family protein [Murinocardiopsis flavida]PSK89914.1 hypothetical protein CLV63_12418 [Murinocardiopsis flavida]